MSSTLSLFFISLLPSVLLRKILLRLGALTKVL